MAAADLYPWSAFNFEVQIKVEGLGEGFLCDALFSDCDGIEMTMDAKTIREGGNNSSQIRLIGGVNYGTVTLKRGMTRHSFLLWNWFNAQQHALPQQLRRGLRGEARVVLRSADRKDNAAYTLRKCVLTKLKAPAMNAKEGMVAVEELQLLCESISIEDPGGDDA